MNRRPAAAVPQSAPAAGVPAKRSVAKRLIAAAIVVVVAVEAIDELRSFSRRVGRRANWWLAGVEQHERRRLHVEELGYLVRHLNPR